MRVSPQIGNKTQNLNSGRQAVTRQIFDYQDNLDISGKTLSSEIGYAKRYPHWINHDRTGIRPVRGLAQQTNGPSKRSLCTAS
jgi:hypothetical protein